jgi:O-antigen ligase
VIAVLASVLMFAQVVFPSMEIIATRSESLITAGQSFTGIERLYFQGDRIIYVLLLIVLVSFITKGKLLPSWLEFGLIGIIGVGEFFTFQRNYWLTILAMTALLFAMVSQAGRFRFFQWITSCVLLFFIAINIPGFPVQYLDAAVDRITRGIELDTLLQDTSTQYRVNETRYAIQTIQQKPYTGIGLGNYYRPAFPNEDPWNNETNLRWYIHNSYLWVWIDMGLIGIVPFVWFYAASIIRCLKNWRKVVDSRLRAFVLGSTLGVLGQSISNFVAPNFIQSWVLAIFPLVIGMNEVILRCELFKNGEQ